MSGLLLYIISLVTRSRFPKFFGRKSLVGARLTGVTWPAGAFPISSEVSNARKFEQEIASVYAKLAEKQEPLEREFAVVWDENAEQLYES